MDIIAAIETRVAHLAHCLAHMKGGTCPLIEDRPVPAAVKVAKPARARQVRKQRKFSAPAPKAVAVAPSHRRQSLAGVSKDTRVLDLVSEHHGLTATDVGQRIGDSTPTVYSRLQRLVREGKLTVGADKKYRRAIASEA